MSIRAVAAFLCLLSFVAAAPSDAARAQAPSRPVGKAVEEWNRSFERIAQELTTRELSAARAETIKRNLATIEAEARKIKLNAAQAIGPLEVQRKALGPPPAEGEPPEVEAIAAQRQKIDEDIASYQARIKQADLALTRAKELSEQVAARTLARSIELLFRSYPFALAPSTIAEAVPDFFAILEAIARSPLDWWESLTPDQRDEIVFVRLPFVLLLAFAIGWGLRRVLLRWFGRDPAIQKPTYARRLAGAIADGLAYGIVPSLILAGFILGVRSSSAFVDGFFAEVVVTFCAVMIMFILAWALPRAVLAPEHPAWRVVPFPPAHARAISRRVTILAAIFAADLFFGNTSQGLAVSDALTSVYTLVTKSLEAAGILALTGGGLWRWEEEAPEAGEQGATVPASRRWQVWANLRRTAGVLAIAVIASALFGYANFSRYLAESLVISGMTIGILYLVRGLGREAIGIALRSNVVQLKLGIPHKTRSRYKFWLRALLDALINIGGIFLILVIWGVPPESILTWARGALQEITIGNVTISLSDIFVAIFVFVAVMTVTRATQRLLNERIFPQTDLDTGIRHSLSAGLGYAGMALATLLAVSAVGLGLSNIALIAGALSVGIGFGLQNIVNNFVSGLILLAERPVKVGDWVVVAGFEGTVKRINVRATEIETFQRASVIVPNSEMISGAVTNWTHKDRYGRVELPVGVAYGSDVEKVMEILKDCLRANEEILPWPEPYVLFRRFGDSSLDFEARGYIGNVERRIRIASDLCVAIERALREAGIEIPFPQRDLHIRSAEGLSETLARQADANRGE